ncbi:hypothetical protein MP638_002097 [Amoeboaphelidium occidentale]|nr:hypothetical protein MP638_002097 [Amoeboaphelidium occidentale]
MTHRNLLDLPSELIQFIASFLDDYSLCCFKESSVIIESTLNCIAFDIAWLKNIAEESSIIYLLNNEYMFNNWKEILERLLEDEQEFVRHFTARLTKYAHTWKREVDQVGSISKRRSTMIRITHELRCIFDRHACSAPKNLKLVSKEFEQCKNQNLELLKSNTWHLMEDLFFKMWFAEQLQYKWDYDENFDIQPYISVLNFAERKQHKECFTASLNNMAIKIMRYVVKKKIPHEKGVEFLDKVLPRVTDTKGLAEGLANILDWTIDYKTNCWEIWEHVLDYFKEDRRIDLKNLVLWSMITVCKMVDTLPFRRQNTQPAIKFIKNLRNWSHNHCDLNWEQSIDLQFKITPSLLDEDLRSEFFPDGVL